MIPSPEFFKEIKHWNYQARARLEAEDFAAVSGLMFLIRGTAQVFGCFQIANITSLGEEISYCARRSQIGAADLRKCVGCLWDILTTLDYLISRGFEQTTEEQKILIFRAESVLKSFDQLRDRLTQSEIDVIVRAQTSQRDLARKG